MVSRDQSILDLRFKAKVYVEDSVSSAEQFQNLTLRPILKFQNELLIQVLKVKFQERKDVFYTLSNSAKKDYLKDLIHKDHKFCQLLMGLVIGLFTSDEWTIFLAQKQELRRRIRSLLIQRFHDQLSSL